MGFRVSASTGKLSRTASLPSSTAITMGGWFNTVAKNAGIFNQMMGMTSASSVNWCGLEWNTTGSLITSNNAGNTAFGSAPSTGEWYYAAISNAGTGGSDFKGYWRGIAGTGWNSTTTATGISFTPASMGVLNDVDNEWCDAIVADFRIWDAVLSSDELLNEAMSGVPKRLANLHLWTPCWRPGDTKDYSGNGKDWTESGSPSAADHAPVTWFDDPDVMIISSGGSPPAANTNRWWFAAAA